MKLLFLFLVPLFLLSASPKAIVFDYGRVIVHLDTSKVKAFLQESLQLTEEEYSDLSHLSQKRPLGFLDQSYFFPILFEKKGIDVGWYQLFEEVILESVQEDKNMIGLVKLLQEEGFQTPLFSNIYAKHAEVVRKRGGYDVFHPVLLSCEIGANKPDPQSYILLVDALSLLPEEILFIDDQIENVIGAKKIGIDAIQFTSYSDLLNELKKRHLL